MAIALALLSIHEIDSALKVLHERQDYGYKEHTHLLERVRQLRVAYDAEKNKADRFRLGILNCVANPDAFHELLESAVAKT